MELKYEFRSALGLAWPISAIVSMIATFAVVVFVPLQGMNGYLIAIVFFLICAIVTPIVFIIQLIRFPRTLTLAKEGIIAKTVFGESKQFAIERLSGIQRRKRTGRQWMILFELTNGPRIFGFVDLYKIEALKEFSDRHGFALQ